MPVKLRVTDTVLQAAFCAQLLCLGLGFDPRFLAFLVRSISSRKSPRWATASHPIGSFFGKQSFDLSVVLFLYCFCPGQAMCWYNTLFFYLASREAVSAFLSSASIQDTTAEDWFWAFDRYAWFYRPDQLEFTGHLFSKITRLSTTEAEKKGIPTDWGKLEAGLTNDIWTRTLSVMMDLPRPNPALFGRQIFEIKLRASPSLTPTTTFLDTVSIAGVGPGATIQDSLLHFIPSESFAWQMMWVYAPRNVAYIAAVEWEKLVWLGTLLLQKMVHDVIGLLGTSLTVTKVTALTAALTSRETLAALLDSVGYFGERKYGIPSLDMARKKFVVLFALSFLSFIGKEYPTFSDWFLDGFGPLVRLADQEFEREQLATNKIRRDGFYHGIDDGYNQASLVTPPIASTATDQPSGSSVTIQSAQTSSHFNASLYVRPRACSLPGPIYNRQGGRRSLTRVNGRYVPLEAPKPIMAEPKEDPEPTLRRSKSFLGRVADLIMPQRDHTLTRRRSFMETLTDIANDTHKAIADDFFISRPFPKASTETATSHNGYAPPAQGSGGLAEGNRQIQGLTRRWSLTKNPAGILADFPWLTAPLIEPCGETNTDFNSRIPAAQGGKLPAGGSPSVKGGERNPTLVRRHSFMDNPSDVTRDSSNMSPPRNTIYRGREKRRKLNAPTASAEAIPGPSTSARPPVDLMDFITDKKLQYRMKRFREIISKPYNPPDIVKDHPYWTNWVPPPPWKVQKPEDGRPDPKGPKKAPEPAYMRRGPSFLPLPKKEP